MVSTYFPQPNKTSFIDLVKYANVVTDGHFGELMLIAIFLVVYMTTIKFGVERALTVSMFITAISSYFMVIFGLLDPRIIAIPTVILILSVIFLFKESR